MSNLSHNFEGEQGHPPQDRFLLFVDGELSGSEAEQLQSHLDACWSCRVSVAKIEETITEIVEFETTVSQFQLSRTPGGWGNFDSKLNTIAQEIDPPTLVSRFVDFWKHNEIFRFSPARIAVPTVAALLIAVLVYQFVLVAPVSAAEILRLSSEAEAARLNETVQPVLHQRLQVTRKGSAPVDLEIWNDTVSSRVRLASLGGTPAQTSDVADLQAILRLNRMNEHRPLSADSFKAWSDSLAAKTEGVEKADGILTIKAVPAQITSNDQITEARFSVREGDYRPTALHIKTGNQEFELIERSFEIVSLKDIDPAIFADPTNVEVASTVGTLPKPGASASPVEPATDETANTNANIAPPPTVAATTADEVEVLNRLHQIGADITEQLNVTRTADGRLLVEGLVETDKRKHEILNALAPVRNNRAIRVRVQTLEEATRALQRQKAQATPGTVERVEVEKGTLAVDAELRAYFERNSGNEGETDEKIRAFVSRAINRAKGAAFQASALNRMASRFNAEQLAGLDPAARAKYLGMLKGYAAAVRRETAALRGELQPIFGDVSDLGSESVTSDADLIASSRRLFELASQNDRVIRSALTISSGGASVSAIKSAQFRRSLGQAEALAAAIERAK